MLKSLYIMAFALFGVISTVSAMDDHGHTHGDEMMSKEASKPTVAVFYADWCGSCKILEPNMKEAMGMMDNADALNVVTFDLTDDATKAKSVEMAAENNLTDLYNAKAPKTGFAVLVGETMDDNVTITKADSVGAIKAKLEAFIATDS